MTKPSVVIIGAGPAGLTAALELTRKTDIQPIVLEESSHMGGISRTTEYKGNRIDIGGHRFFSKSDRVMAWWLEIMPLQAAGPAVIVYQNQRREVDSAATAAGDEVMLLRPRKSRIYYLRSFFDYPISLSVSTLRNLGFSRTVKIGLSYLWSSIHQIKPERTLEHFLINRFGKELYQLFFRSYTEKVWGVPCSQISAEWGAQRIKGLSIGKAIAHNLKKLFSRSSDIRQKDTETSLIEQFMYPKYGPGQLWDIVARKVVGQGGQILTGYRVERLRVNGRRIVAVEARCHATGETQIFEGGHFLSTMPMRELIHALDCEVPRNVREVADGLVYRDFITVGLLLKKMKVTDGSGSKRLPDTWIYVQEPDVLVGRVQIFNNWSEYLVADPDTVWIGLEYFCYDTDAIWKLSDAEMIALAAEELDKIGIIHKEDVLDGTVIRVPKTYPAYFGTYDRFGELREYLDRFENLFLVGRNGMHKYNNQDHSMLTAMEAVDNIARGVSDKANLWAVNTEAEYHETKKES